MPTKNVRLIIDAINNTKAHFDSVLASIQQTNAATARNAAVNAAAQAAIQRLSANNQLLANSLVAVNQRLAQQTAAAAQARQQLTQLGQAKQSTANISGQLNQALGAVKIALASLAIREVVDQLVEANIQFQRITNSLAATVGPGAATAKEFAFVRGEAERLGVFLPEIANEYTKLTAAGKPLGFSTQQLHDIFSSVTGAAVVLGLSMDDVHGTLRAVQQMMSKGTVQAEELRGQLGERLPGAVSLSAKALGVTTQQLGKMLEQGQVMAMDLLPALARELNNTFGPQVETASQSTARQIDRLKTAFFEFKLAVGDSQFMAAFLDVVKATTTGLQALNQTAAETPALMAAITTAMAGLAGAAVSGGIASLAVKLGASVEAAGGLAAVLAGPAFAAFAVGGAIAIAATAWYQVWKLAADEAERMAQSMAAIDSGLRQDLSNANSLVTLETVRRQTIVQIHAEMAKGADQDFTRVKALQTILRNLNEQGETIVKANQLQAETLRVEREHTNEINKQRAALEARAKKLPETEKAYQNQVNQGSGSDDATDRAARRAAMQKELAQLQTKLNTPLPTGEAQTPEQVKTAFLAVIQHDLETRTRILQVQRELNQMDVKERQEAEQALKAAQTEMEVEQRRLGLAQQQDILRRRSEISGARERIAQDPNILKDDRRAATVGLIARENQLIQERTGFIRQEIAVLASRPAQTEQDRLQAMQLQIQYENELAQLEKDRTKNNIESAQASASNFEQLQQAITAYANKQATITENIGTSIVAVGESARTALGGAFADMILKAQTFKDAMFGVGNAIAIAFINNMAQMVADFIYQHTVMAAIRAAFRTADVSEEAVASATRTSIAVGEETAKTAATATGATARGGIRVAETIFHGIQVGIRFTAHLIGELKQTAVTLAQYAIRLPIILAESGAYLIKAAIGAMSAMASIPYVGPILAIVAMAGILAAGASLLKGFADGGLIGGEGTGRSDSNVVRVSKGEFIVPADVVSKMGADSLYSMVRETRFGRSGAPAQAMAAGISRLGVQGSVSNTVNVPEQAVHVVVVSDKEELQRELRSRQGRSAVVEAARSRNYLNKR